MEIIRKIILRYSDTHMTLGANHKENKRTRRPVQRTKAYIYV